MFDAMQWRWMNVDGALLSFDFAEEIWDVHGVGG
jgi:hypothetical protein